MSKITIFQNNEHLSLFKKEVKKQMLGSGIGIVIGGLIIGSIILHGPMDNTVYVLILSTFTALFVFSRFAKRIETQIAAIPTENEEIKKSKQTIVKIWRTKIVPKFDE